MTVLGSLKRFVNRMLERRGQVVAHADLVPSFDRLVRLLDRYGLRPRTVIDVGVAEGTPWLYEAWPDARFLLIDPTRESQPHMEAWARRLRAEIIPVALGEAEGALPIRIRDDGIGGSSLFAEIGPHRLMATYDVPVRRFDVSIPAFDGPTLCKVDVQGAELMVLRGMGERLSELDCMIIETSLIRTLHGGAPEFADVAGFLRGKGWVLYDIVGFTRRPLDGALAQIDAVFVPEASPLRADRRWTA